MRTLNFLLTIGIQCWMGILSAKFTHLLYQILKLEMLLDLGSELSIYTWKQFYLWLRLNLSVSDGIFNTCKMLFILYDLNKMAVSIPMLWGFLAFICSIPGKFFFWIHLSYTSELKLKFHFGGWRNIIRKFSNVLKLFPFLFFPLFEQMWQTVIVINTLHTADTAIITAITITKCK